MTASDSEHIIDAVNEVSNNFAVSSADLANNLGNVSSVLSVTGTTFEQTLGLLTSITEVTRNASKASRGLVQISSRLTQVLDDSSKTGAKLKDIYGGLGIALMDSNGQIRSTYDILEDLSKQWDNLSKNEQEYIALTSAGSNQVQNFSALMENFSVAIDATTTAYDSAGSAAAENEKAMDTIDKKVQLLRSQFEQLVIGKGGLQDFAKGLLDVGIGALQLVNNLGGLPSVITAITTTIIALNATKILTNLTNFQDKLVNISSVITNFGGNLKSIIPLWQQYYAVQGMVVAGTATTATATEALNLALTATAPILQLVALAIGAVVVGINAHNKVVEEAKQASKDRNAQLLEEVNTLKQAKQELQNESISRNELNSIISENLSTYKDEIDQIEDVNEARKKAIDLIKEESKEKLQQYIDRGKQEYKEAISATTSATYQDYMAPNFARRSFSKESLNQAQQQIVSSKGIKELTSSYENYLSVLNEEIEKVEEGSIVYNDYREEIYRVIETLSTLETDEQKYKDIISTYNDALVSQGQIYDETTGKIRGITTEEYARYAQQKQTKEITDAVTDSTEEYADATSEVIDNIEKLASSLGLTNSQLERYSSLMGDIELENFLQNLQDIRDASNDASTGIDNLQSALETAIEAQAEYAASGDLTLDTFQSLMSINVNYLAALENENGQLEINQQTLSNLVEQIKIAKIEEIQSAAAADLMAYSTGQVDEMSATAQTAVATLGENIETTGTKAETASGKMVSFAAGVAAAVEASGGKVDFNDSGQQVIIDAYEDIADRISKLTVDTTRYGNTASKAHSKAAKATDKEKSAADSLKDKYKTVIDFIIKQYDKQIDKIKEAKDAAIKSVESQIKALEKEKDSKVKAIDAEITALQRERDAREKYWQDQLDKLEKENNERERNIALQEKQQALALAQQTNVMVLKDGQFQYTQDETAVAGAEQDLAEQEDQNEYERQKELIEELRDTELEWYDERIQSLEDYKEQVEEYYEEQIEQLEEYKEYLEEYYDAQIEALEAEKEAVNETLEEGAANQQEYWDKMKEQLQAFVEEWNALVGEMKFPNISGSGISLSSVGGKISASMGGKSTGDNKVSAYASGKGSIGDSEIAVVGENPKYRELVIGSKLNNDQGVVMSLKRGSGVVNAGATNTLASIFNSLNGQKSVGQPVSNSSQSMSIQIGSISLPEVKDGQGFVDYLQNFSADITQQSFRRA